MFNFVVLGLSVCIWASQVVLVVKNLPANAGDVKDMGLIPGSGRSPGGGHGSPLSILAWRIPWTEEPGELQSMGSQRVEQDSSDLTHTHTPQNEQHRMTCVT